jgi:NitT/TauT family transport system ATP-binding protein
MIATRSKVNGIDAPSPAQSADRPGTNAIELRSVGKTFPNGTQALAPIDLTVRAGEFLTLIGPSGCGKSTLLRLAANLIGPSSGSVRWWDSDASALGQPGRQMAFVFQDPTLMPWSRVETNVRLPLDLAGVARSEADERVAAALGQVGLTKFRRSYPRQLSGGMRMRVSIARALVTNPDLLLMDEPFGALDEFTRNRLDDDLLRLSFERRLTTVFVTHSIYEAVFLSTRIIVMTTHPGRIFHEFVVDEPEPRSSTFRTSPRFAELCGVLSSILTDATLASGSDE